MSDDARERGLRVRREVLGDAHVDAALAATSALTAAFQDLITRYAWGEVWAGGGLERRERSLVTVALMVALGREPELELHLRAARRNGVGWDELAALLLHCAVYCGVPAANGAFALAQRLHDEEAAGA